MRIPGRDVIRSGRETPALARRYTEAKYITKLPRKTVDIGCAGLAGAPRSCTVACSCSDECTAPCAVNTIITIRAWPCACAVVEQDPTSWTGTRAVGAVAATARSAAGAAGTAIRYAHRRRSGSGSLRRSGSGSLRRSGSGSLAGSADADETATALRVPRAVLADALTPRTVGPSLTDAHRSQRAP